METWISTCLTFKIPTAVQQGPERSSVRCSGLCFLLELKQTPASRRMDYPGCCCSFCQTKIEAGILAKNNRVFVFHDWPFQRRSILAASQQSSLYLIHCVKCVSVSTQTAMCCCCSPPPPLSSSNVPLSYGRFADCEWPLRFQRG